jgi:hemerythrin-like domain-containing protein
MNVIHALLGEHAILKQQIRALRGAAPRLESRELRTAALSFAEAVESHARLEDELLFEALEATGKMPVGPILAMREEHRRIEERVGRLTATPSAGDAAGEDRKLLGRLLETLADHFAHEEHVLFALAGSLLDPVQLGRLGARWAERRGVVLAVHGALVAGAGAAAMAR